MSFANRLKFGILIALWLFCLSVPVFAGDVTLTWTAPTGQEQCAPAAGPPVLAGFRIYQLVADIQDPDVTEYTFPGLLPDTYNYVSTALDTDGNESRMSGMAEKVVDTFVTSDTKVYTMTSLENRIALVVVGSVPLGVACDPDQSVNGFHAVPIDTIDVPETTDILFALAQCS